jgi:hypothetical protein
VTASPLDSSSSSSSHQAIASPLDCKILAVSLPATVAVMFMLDEVCWLVHVQCTTHWWQDNTPLIKTKVFKDSSVLMSIDFVILTHYIYLAIQSGR